MEIMQLTSKLDLFHYNTIFQFQFQTPESKHVYCQRLTVEVDNYVVVAGLNVNIFLFLYVLWWI